MPVVEEAAASSACSRARSCSAASPRTSRRSSTRIPAALVPLAAGVRAGRRRTFLGRRQLRRGERDAVEDVALAHLDRVEPEVRERLVRITAPATITGARSGSSAGSSRRSRERQCGEPIELRTRAVEREPVAVRRARGRTRRGRGRARRASSPCPRRRSPACGATSSVCEQRADRAAHCVELVRGRRIGVHEPLGEAHGADVEAHVEVVDDQLGRAAADVERRASPGAGSTPRRVSSASSSPLTRAASRSRSSTRSRRGTPRRSRRRAPRSSRRASVRSAPRLSSVRR